jgi:hypothetical protein
LGRWTPKAMEHFALAQRLIFQTEQLLVFIMGRTQ